MKVKTRTIYMLAAILVVMVSAYLLDEWYRFNRNSVLLRQEHSEIVSKFFKSIGKRTDSVLRAEAGLIVRDHNTVDALKKGDRQILYKNMQPYMRYMKAIFPGSRIILNFYEPDGTLYLAADNPSRFGVNNSLYRPILHYVSQNKKEASGLELCSSTLSQRYITPVMAGGKMIGILEVSTDINFIANRIASISSIKTAVLLDGTAIDKVKKSTHVTYNENYFNNSPVPYSLLRSELQKGKSYFHYKNTEYEIIKSFPLATFKNGRVGDMYFVTKTGGLESWFREHIARAMLLCIIGVMLVIYVARRGFIESIAELEKEHDEALRDLKKINAELEDRVSAAVENCRRKDQIINQQQKVADMGMMLSALAHHWRQPINAVGLYVQDLSDAYRSGELTKDYIDDFERNNMDLLTKLSDSIDKYRTFFEPSTEKTNFEITTILTEISEVLNATLASSGIKLNVSCNCGEESFECNFYDKMPACADKKTEISGFLNEFKQTLLNILYNSIDAILQRYKMQGGNRDGQISIVIRVDGDTIYMDIADNGTGIPDGLMDKVFNPFFTTKEEGAGTGIGLYMAKTVIEKYMCGSITAENNGRGVTMHIVLHRNLPCL